MGRLPNVLLVVVAACCLWVASGRAVDAEFALEEGAPMAVATLNPLTVTPTGAHTESAAPSSSAFSRHRSLMAIRTVFGDHKRARRVAQCESKLDYRAVSPTSDYGLYQLNRPTWDPARNPRARPYWPKGKDWRHVFDPYVNARVAWAISKRGTDFWTHWRWSARCWA